MAMNLGVASPALSFLKSDTRNNFTPLSSSSVVLLTKQQNELMVVCAASKPNRELTGVVFEPFEEVKKKKELMLIPTLSHLSLARHNYSNHSESAINHQINVEYNVSYAYHAMFAYFDRDNVALKGLARFFKECSAEERQQAQKFIEYQYGNFNFWYDKYQNKRGGKVKLQSIIMPASEFDHTEKGDALYAMELALSLQKLTSEKLQLLHEVAVKNKDAQMADFVQNHYLRQQVKAIKKISEYVAQLRRVAKGHGVWHFDQMLLNEAAAAAAV